MLRREFFNWLGGLPFCGHLKEDNQPKSLELVCGKLERVRFPKLRLWTLNNPNDKAIEKLKDIIINWDKENDLDIIWDQDLTVQQFDIVKGDEDVVLGSGDTKAEQISIDNDGTLLAKISCKEPFIRIINKENKT